MKIKKPSGQEVIEFLDVLEHPMKREIEVLRKIILNSNTKLTEHIKWNAPSFCIENEDRVTMKLHPAKNIQLIFHRGAKVKAQPKEQLISGYSSFLKWPANDRAVATFANMDEIKLNEKVLSEIINEWIKATT